MPAQPPSSFGHTLQTVMTGLAARCCDVGGYALPVVRESDLQICPVMDFNCHFGGACVPADIEEGLASDTRDLVERRGVEWARLAFGNDCRVDGGSEPKPRHHVAEDLFEVTVLLRT